MYDVIFSLIEVKSHLNLARMFHEFVSDHSVMIGHNGNETKISALSDSAIAGGLSGALTRLLLQPLDVIKTRFQVTSLHYMSFISIYAVTTT